QKAIKLVIEILQTINYTLTISSKHKEDSHMRLAQGIILDKEKTFGLLKFSALRREVFLQNEDGTVSTEVKERTYDLKSKEQGRMIQVSIPASIPVTVFDYSADVALIVPVADTAGSATVRGADVDWIINADESVLKGKASPIGDKSVRKPVDQHK